MLAAYFLSKSVASSILRGLSSLSFSFCLFRRSSSLSIKNYSRPYSKFLSRAGPLEAIAAAFPFFPAAGLGKI